jgi:hypothetical protein
MLALAALICAALFAGAVLQALLAGRAVALQAALLLAGAAAAGAAWGRYHSNWYWLGAAVLLLIGFALTLPANREKTLLARVILGLIAVALVARGLLP